MPLYQKCQWDVLHLYQTPCPLWLQQSPSTESIPVKQLKVKNLHVHVFIDDAELHRLVIQCKTIQVTEVDESWCPVTQIRDDTFAFDGCISPPPNYRAANNSRRSDHGQPNFANVLWDPAVVQQNARTIFLGVCFFIFKHKSFQSTTWRFQVDFFESCPKIPNINATLQHLTVVL